MHQLAKPKPSNNSKVAAIAAFGLFAKQQQVHIPQPNHNV